MVGAPAPLTAFLIAPIAQYVIIPFIESADGRGAWGWLLGEGQARGIALIFVFAGIAIVLLVLIAFGTRAYRRLSDSYANAAVPQIAAGGA